MATTKPTTPSRSSRSTSRRSGAAQGRSNAKAAMLAPIDPRYTGRYIVVFSEPTTAAAMSTLKATSGLSVASSSDFTSGAAMMPDTLGSAVYLEHLGVAIASAPPEQMRGLGVSAANRMQIVPERYMFTAGTLSVDAAYLKGYRSGVNALVEDLLNGGDLPALPAQPSRVTAANADFTWNLAATGVSQSKFRGRGIKLAVLDTGFDQEHPDLQNRVALSNSFVPGLSVQDNFGHGTHCVGIAAGLASPISVGPRYGSASEVELLVGKVLGDDGRGDEGWLLNGLNWALENGADVVSLSIEGPYDPSSPILPQYEAIGARALAAGRLIVAAAGNYSIRPLVTRPVASPACATSIMSVGAIGPDDLVAAFSCEGGPGGAVDLAAPGVAIESSFPTPRVRKVESGTSMAAPLVAGIAALHMEAQGDLRGQALWDRLTASARKLSQGASDVGAGCAYAP